MARVLLYYAHPGHRFSRANAALFEAARAVEGIEALDLYAAYPRHDIDVRAEQARLLGHDVVVIQCPLFWYSTPALVKEWQDLVLQYGFAYGPGGTALAGKALLFALTVGAGAEAYARGGFNHYPLRTFLTPLERTATLCGMRFLAPYVLYGALAAPGEGGLAPHVEGYTRLLSALRDDRLDLDAAEQAETLAHDSLPQLEAR
ncbi:MAG: NAD(P)H-dependent oxidoreductase [Pseudomonadota bacterium]